MDLLDHLCLERSALKMVCDVCGDLSIKAIDPVDAVRSFRREMGLVFELNLPPAPDEARAAFTGPGRP